MGRPKDYNVFSLAFFIYNKYFKSPRFANVNNVRETNPGAWHGLILKCQTNKDDPTQGFDFVPHPNRFNSSFAEGMNRVYTYNKDVTTKKNNVH
jgi:hypothetical protein